MNRSKLQPNLRVGIEESPSYRCGKQKDFLFFMFECPHCGALWALAWLRLVGKKELVWMYVTTGCLRPAPFSTGVAVARLVLVPAIHLAVLTLSTRSRCAIAEGTVQLP